MFITLKVGYTSGIYGCSGEQFNTIIINGDKVENILFNGMYGAESRINNALKTKGYEEKYINTNYGKMTRKDAEWFIPEQEALELIKTNF